MIMNSDGANAKDLANMLEEKILALGLDRDADWEAEQGDYNLLVQFTKACPNSFWEDARVDNVCFKLWFKKRGVPMCWLEDEPVANAIFEELGKAIQ